MKFNRREFLTACLGGSLLGGLGYYAWDEWRRRSWQERVFIGKAPDYHADLATLIRRGLKELGVTPGEVRGKRILLKPNLVEIIPGALHLNTHPLVIRGAAEAFLSLGASRVVVAEGPGHVSDTYRVVEETGLAEVLREDRLPFVDLNYEPGYQAPNILGYSPLSPLILPAALKEVDWVVSVAKMKTHHWAGITLSMKNLFGVMPGGYYGWPKNILHWAGIDQVILDLNVAVKPRLAIVDGIVGMEGDGPIMGEPKFAGVLVLGRNLPAVDATCARLMGVNPHRVHHLAVADGRLGPVREDCILQVGEPLAAVRTVFRLLEEIPAQRALRA